MFKKILAVSLFAPLLGLAGCGGSDEDGGEFGNPLDTIDNTFPNGVWEVTDYDVLGKSTNSGAVIIDPEWLVGYYDFDTGQDCNLDFTTKIETVLVGTATDRRIPTPIGITATLVDTGNGGLDFTWFDFNMVKIGHITLTNRTDYNGNSSAPLDARTCDPEPIGGITSI